jgi:hypothetical protein
MNQGPSEDIFNEKQREARAFDQLRSSRAPAANVSAFSSSGNR